MSGTPSISETYSVYGTRHRGALGRTDLSVSLVLLARGPWFFRPEILARFHGLGFPEILLVEDGRPKYDADDVLRRIPELRILIPLREATPGTRINQAAREVRGDKFLVLWDDQSLPDTWWTGRLPRHSAESPAVALVPERRDSQGRDLPSVQVPGLEKDRLKILSLGADVESVDTLFPADYTALYDRTRFLRTGGFDPGLASPFWQKVDWGLRSRLWGETLTVERSFKVDYLSTVPWEDQTPDRSYPRFFLRNLAVRHVGDHGILPFSRFWSLARGGSSWGASLSTFLQERAWVRTHRYRFKTDARLLTELWGNP